MDWQREWDAAKYGRWTHRLLLSLETWLKYAPDMDYYTSQIMTGHGCFAAFKYRIGKADTPACWLGCTEEDTAEHHLVKCVRWQEERMRLVDAMLMPTGAPLTAEALMNWILTKKEFWKYFRRFCTDILPVKESLERAMNAAEAEEVLARQAYASSPSEN